jgi:hypothetical protein
MLWLWLFALASHLLFVVMPVSGGTEFHAERLMEGADREAKEVGLWLARI